jgi:hypothetical protein
VVPHDHGLSQNGRKAQQHGPVTHLTERKKYKTRTIMRKGHRLLGQKAARRYPQAYVSCTRGREGVRVYTDDKDGLRERIVHSGLRGSATELLAGQVAANTRPRDVTERAMKDHDRLRTRVAYRRKHEAIAEAI